MPDMEEMIARAIGEALPGKLLFSQRHRAARSVVKAVHLYQAKPVECATCHGDGFFVKPDITGDEQCTSCRGTGMDALVSAERERDAALTDGHDRIAELHAEADAATSRIAALETALRRVRVVVHDVAIATRNVGYDADLRAIDTALSDAAMQSRGEGE